METMEKKETKGKRKRNKIYILVSFVSYLFLTI